jgi:small-conductance mechanosensitive channel
VEKNFPRRAGFEGWGALFSKWKGERMRLGSPRRGGWLTWIVASSMTLILHVGPAPSTRAQDPLPEPPPPTPTPAPTAIPASKIPVTGSQTAAVLRNLELNAQPREGIALIGTDLPSVVEDIDRAVEEAEPLIESGATAEVLKDARAGHKQLEKRVDDWLGVLTGRAAELDRDLADLRDRKMLWQLTLDNAPEAELPESLVAQVREILEAITRTERTINARRHELLDLQASVAEQRDRLRLLSEEIGREIDRRQRGLLRLDSPPIWRVFTDTGQDSLVIQVAEAVQRNLVVLERFVRTNARALLLHVVMFIFLIAIFFRLGRHARLWARSDESLRRTADLLQHPVSASLLMIGIVTGTAFHNTAPVAAQNLAGVILLLVVIRLTPYLVRRELRPAITMFVLLVALYLLVELIPSAFLLDRIGWLFLALFGAAACAWAVRRARSLGEIERAFWYWATVWFATASAVLFAVSAAANIVGAVSFGSQLTAATLTVIYDAVIVWMFVVVAMSALTVVLRTNLARRLLSVRYHGDQIRAVVFRWIQVIAVVVWFGSALEGFALLAPTIDRLRAIFLAEFSIGEFSISLFNIVIFVIVIWLSLKLSQLVSFILDTDVLPRLDLPKGVPATISKTSTYAIMTVGTVIAVIAAGLDVSRATILVGALGVGIGFGLQNAVNNFVSGLILLFSRPINVGDKIQVADVSGVVTDIGIRATVVRTWQGAEVIVPNATLISDNLVNWTLTDDRRRMEIPVGVAYGSPTDRVIEILTDVALAHEQVLDEPAPVALFQGFGTSSLDFELRAWTADDFVAIASELRVGIERALAEHGIEIPFPQRDLHLRTVDERAAVRLSGTESAADEKVADRASDDEAPSVP